MTALHLRRLMSRGDKWACDTYETMADIVDYDDKPAIEHAGRTGHTVTIAWARYEKITPLRVKRSP